MSSLYFVIAWAGTDACTSPVLASCESTARTIDSASTWKNRRAAGRVSEKPNPSVPRDAYDDAGTQRAIWSGTARIQSETATTGPGASDSTVVTYGTRVSASGCSRLCDSHASASRRSSVHEVTDHTSAAMPQSSASSRCAVSAHGTATPEARSCARGVATVGGVTGAYLYMPRRMPSSRPSVAGAGGCG